MIARIVAIVGIFICTAIAWMILGGTVMSRTQASRTDLSGKVASIWGAPQEQFAPSLSFDKELLGSEKRTVAQPLESSHIKASVDLEHRQKGLLWYSTYKVGFQGAYRFRNASGEKREMTLTFPFPAQQAIYDDLVVKVNGQPVHVTPDVNAATTRITLEPDAPVNLEVAYRSQGLDSWKYSFGKTVTEVRDFSLTLETNFADADFPENSLSPTMKTRTAKGWTFEWNYKNLVSGYQIALTCPEKLQPGPLAGQISFFAPVSLFFFFFLMFIITTMRGIRMHPMNYFFLAAAFFAFHLLLAYLVDHISIHVAFVICSAVSIFLVVSYLRLVVGTQFAIREAGLVQFVYLVLFSYAFFFKGFTGLAITIGAIVTLFVVMQVTGRIKWEEKFAKPLA